MSEFWVRHICRHQLDNRQLIVVANFPLIRIKKIACSLKEQLGASRDKEFQYLLKSVFTEAGSVINGFIENE